MIREISEKEQVKYGLQIFSFLNIIICAIYACIPIWDLQWYRQTFSGSTIYFPWGTLWWVISISFLLNYMLIITLFAVIADSKQKTRADIHFIITYAALLGNVLSVVICTLWYFFYSNKSYSGTQPSNDPLWCCLYYMINAGICPNNSPCAITPTLENNPSFILLWIFSGVFFIVNILHIVFNRMLRSSKIITQKLKSIDEPKYLAMIVSWVHLALFIYWAALPLWDTISRQLYTYQWVFLYFLCFNIIPPLLFLFSLNFRESPSINNTFIGLTGIVSFIDAICLCVFIYIWGFSCNNNFLFTSDQSICNDYRYCCQHFDTSPQQCLNVTPCPYTLNLSINPEFVQHMIFSFVFGVFGVVLIWINFRLKAYKYFPKPK
jgi:hypothetical protein